MINSLRQNLFIPLYDKMHGTKRISYLKSLKKEFLLTKSELKKRQKRKLNTIIDYAYNNIPFYRKLYDKHEININKILKENKISEIPIISKDDIRKSMKEILNHNFRKKNLVRTATGGTTQAPIPFYLDRSSYDFRQAFTLYFFGWFNYKLGDKIAYLWGAELDFPKKISFKSRFVEFLTYRKLILPSSYLNKNVMSLYYNRIKNFRPKVLQAYPTPLYIFSCFLERNNLKLAIPNIEVTAERLYSYQRKKIEKVFKNKIFWWYGAREIGHGATECYLHNGMHINSYGLYLEVIHNRKNVYDEYGGIVITDLYNKAMPLIRYNIGDIGILSQNDCPCGNPLPLLKDVIGRHGDVFKKRDGSMIPGVSYPDEITELCKGVDQFQIIQKDYEVFQVNIVKNRNFNLREEEIIKGGICKFMKGKLEISINYVKEIPKEKSGKIRYCKCEIND